VPDLRAEFGSRALAGLAESVLGRVSRMTQGGGLEPAMAMLLAEVAIAWLGGPPPARHRPGARSARRERRRHPTADRIAKETTMLFRSLFDATEFAGEVAEGVCP
jgi:hypothetical protein